MRVPRKAVAERWGTLIRTRTLTRTLIRPRTRGGTMKAPRLPSPAASAPRSTPFTSKLFLELRPSTTLGMGTTMGIGMGMDMTMEETCWRSWR